MVWANMLICGECYTKVIDKINKQKEGKYDHTIACINPEIAGSGFSFGLKTVYPINRRTILRYKGVWDYVL